MKKRGMITTENYKKFQHRECEFFPCHKGVPEEDFNCLFCYCPLYMLKDKCGGNFSYAHGIKDCSGCTKPHDKNSYDHVMSKIGLVMEGGKLTNADKAIDKADDKADDKAGEKKADGENENKASTD